MNNLSDILLLTIPYIVLIFSGNLTLVHPVPSYCADTCLMWFNIWTLTVFQFRKKVLFSTSLSTWKLLSWPRNFCCYGI